MNNNLYYSYQNIWHCQNHSGKLKAITDIVKKYLSKYQYEIDEKGNIFIGNFEKSRPCIVAHLDSVFQKKPKKVRLENGILYSQTGLGGDDKCGIIAILELLKRNENINAILTVDEEIGGKGVANITDKQIENVMYFIEIDRQGKKDIITNIYGDRITNDEFFNHIRQYRKSYKFKQTSGLYTDIYDLCLLSQISCINLSCGYYNPHTSKEYVILKELQHTINFVDEIVKNVRKKYKVPVIPCAVTEEDYDTMNLDFVNDIDELIEIAEFYGDIPYREIAKKAYELGKKKSNPYGLTNSDSMAYYSRKWRAF